MGELCLSHRRPANVRKVEVEERDIVHLRAIGKQAHFSGNHSARVTEALSSLDRERQSGISFNSNPTKCTSYWHIEPEHKDKKLYDKLSVSIWPPIQNSDSSVRVICL